jgi:hypothetical protein
MHFLYYFLQSEGKCCFNHFIIILSHGVNLGAEEETPFCQVVEVGIFHKDMFDYIGIGLVSQECFESRSLCSTMGSDSEGCLAAEVEASMIFEFRAIAAFCFYKPSIVLSCTLDLLLVPRYFPRLGNRSI